jgi:REP-associated tyrosine transposase
MVRPLRLEFPGALYHVMARGNERELIFLDRADHERFLADLARGVTRYGWLLHAYCLLGNHYHLVIETPRPNLALGMRQLNGVYAQAFNRRYRRVGHLLQGRYKAFLIEREEYLLRVCRYVVLNPVRAGLCSHPARWPWSSYAATAGLSEPLPFLTVDWLLAQFGNDRRRAQQAYQQFVADALSDAHTDPRPLADLYLGATHFVRDLSRDLQPLREIKRAQWQPLPPPLEELFADQNPDTIRSAHHHYGYTLTEIADHLGVHYATISRTLRRLEEQEEADLSERKT